MRRAFLYPSHMRRGIACVLAIGIAAGFSPAIAASQVKPGSRCPKIGATAGFSGFKFTCVKSKGKFVWSKGIRVTPQPITTPTTTPTPTPTEPDVARYSLPVKLPTGQTVCADTPTRIVAEVASPRAMRLFGAHGYQDVEVGDKVCRAVLNLKYNNRRLNSRMTPESEKAIALWRQWITDKKSTKVELKYFIDPTLPLSEAARIVSGLQAQSLVMGDLIDIGYVSVAASFSRDHLQSTLTNGSFLEKSWPYARDDLAPDGFCGAEFLFTWSAIMATPSPTKKVGDIYFCEFVLRALDWPGNSHVAAHEMFHSVQMSLAPQGDYRMWYYEGGAMFFGSALVNEMGTGDYDRIHLDLADQLIRDGYKPLRDYSSKDEPGERPSGFFAIEYLVSKFGINAYFEVLRVSQRLGFQEPFSKSLKEVIGLTEAEFFDLAQAYVDQEVAWAREHPKQ